MNVSTLLAGLIIGAVLMLGVVAATGGVTEIDANAVCNERFNGTDWAGNVTERGQGGEVTLTCSNGDRTENITAQVEVKL